MKVNQRKKYVGLTLLGNSEASFPKSPKEAKPDANVPLSEKRELIQAALGVWDRLEPVLGERIAVRAEVLSESHRRIRQAVALKVRNLAVKPQMPPDLLGLLVLQPFAGLASNS